jgi:hypothetical protein
MSEEWMWNRRTRLVLGTSNREELGRR